MQILGGVEASLSDRCSKNANASRVYLFKIIFGWDTKGIMKLYWQLNYLLQFWKLTSLLSARRSLKGGKQLISCFFLFNINIEN